ncbi:MAG: aminotransferase class IV [Planctomycetaceae bacterium]|nr:aminotransferase class IV [Planctomycetaceae bacterium]
MHAESIAWLNGRFLPLKDASLSVFDAGVTSGASVTERLRTFRHQPFLLDEHLDRLCAAANAAFVPLREPTEGMRSIIHHVVEGNAANLPTEHDLAISVFATDGVAGEPSLCVHAAPISAPQYANSYELGIALTTPNLLAMPGDVLSPQIKTRSRLHWHIADRQADRIETGSKALLVDRENYITETSTGNVFIVRGRQLMTPRRTRTLHGISQAYMMRLAADLTLSVAEADLRVDDVLSSDEAFVTSSIYCVLPVVRLNQGRIADGKPGGVFREVLAAWSERVGVDIAGQMWRMAEISEAT